MFGSMDLYINEVDRQRHHPAQGDPHAAQPALRVIEGACMKLGKMSCDSIFEDDSRLKWEVPQPASW